MPKVLTTFFYQKVKVVNIFCMRYFYFNTSIKTKGTVIKPSLQSVCKI